jgi:putative SOS response-associated peptidase YedK
MQQKDPVKKVEKRFNAQVQNPDLFLQDNFINGFSHPNIPVILDKNPKIICTDYSWGLLPYWTKDINFRKNTLNSRIETIHDKPSFNAIINQRCLVIATAFYEWHWNDTIGKSKQKYQINTQEELFAFAGIYSQWTNPVNGEKLNTFSIVTTRANETMEYVHNHKKRMPIILKKEDEALWLNSNSNIDDFAFPYQVDLVAFPVS